jgi:predicted nuclease of predicted toxin-antitoxin system
MKILLDENLPIKLKFKLLAHETYTVKDMSWDSFKNGYLLRTAVEHKFEVFVTTDKNLQHQQNIPNIALAVLVLDVVLLKWSYIEPLIDKILEVIPTTEKGKVYVIK